ncbi:hypothetical protein P23_0215 [Acinetobacter calcoaceticus]|nr:hypothetical protein P23_0215 [Acinetobacter calcoaceticus]
MGFFAKFELNILISNKKSRIFHAAFLDQEII